VNDQHNINPVLPLFVRCNCRQIGVMVVPSVGEGKFCAKLLDRRIVGFAVIIPVSANDDAVVFPVKFFKKLCQIVKECGPWVYLVSILKVQCPLLLVPRHASYDICPCLAYLVE
jgi:hypothetical protein